MKNYIYIFLISMVPLIELRGAIPVAYGIKAAMDNPEEFNLLWAYVVIAVGNMLPVPFIFFFARKVLEWGKDSKIRWFSRFCIWCLEKGEKGGQKLQAKAGRGLYWALVLFVGIPLPGTGAWTGTLAASFLDMDFKKSMFAVLGGIALAGIIVGVLCTLGFGAFVGISYLLSFISYLETLRPHRSPSRPLLLSSLFHREIRSRKD